MEYSKGKGASRIGLQQKYNRHLSGCAGVYCRGLNGGPVVPSHSEICLLNFTSVHCLSSVHGASGAKCKPTTLLSWCWDTTTQADVVVGGLLVGQRDRTVAPLNAHCLLLTRRTFLGEPLSLLQAYSPPSPLGWTKTLFSHPGQGLGFSI